MAVRGIPGLKVEAGSEDISSDSISVELHRPENAVSWVKLVANDYHGKNFVANLDVFTILKVSFRYGSGSWTQVFEGKIREPTPMLTMDGQLATATAYGYGIALRDTHNDAEYGAQVSSSLDTPKEIWDSIVDNQINKSFGGAATGYAITKTKIANITTPTLPYLNGGYRNNLAVVDEVCKIRAAHQAGSAGVHWFVDPSKNLFINTIGNHENDASGWPTWWNTDQAGSTLTEGTDFRAYMFPKRGVWYANKIVVASAFRKPGYDYWTEGQAALWGTDVAGGSFNVVDETTTVVVGSKSIKFDMDAGSARAFIPSTEDAGWNLNKIGSENTIPTLNFYFYKDGNVSEPACSARMFTTDHDTDYYYWVFSTWSSDPDNEWIHRSIPIGPYWKTSSESRLGRWIKGTGVVAGAGGNADWADINGIAFRITSDPSTDAELFIDDLHIAGKIVREAYSSTDITSYDEHQKILRLDTAIDDTLKASDDSGTAALLAYHELLLRMSTPVVGQITVAGIATPEILPGQKVHCHADKQASASFRVDSDFRIKEVIHQFNKAGFSTALDLTDDLTNTYALGYANMFEIWSKAYRIDPEAQNLKASGVDVKIPRLSKDY